MNDRVAGTTVTGSSIDQPYIGNVNYWNASWDEVSALANTSMYCEQWIDYSCYKSRLLNTPGKLDLSVCVRATIHINNMVCLVKPDGRPFGYWIGRDNVSHYYWGGTFREVQMCGCAINQSCIDPKFQCNCDADYRQWWEEGYVCSLEHGGEVTQMRVVFAGTRIRVTWTLETICLWGEWW